ncbi:MAG: S8 family serine peptidase [Gemmataceae bacterium]|nr:S8 family serine peptidase [Gemmataceae bacterium]
MIPLPLNPRSLVVRARRADRKSLRCEALEDRTLLDGGFASGGFPRLVVDPTAYDASSILVRYRPEALARHGVNLGPDIPLASSLHKVGLGGGVGVEAALAAYRADPDVLFAEPNYRIRIQLTPNDPQYPSQWDLNNTGQTGGQVDADLDAPEAWSLTTGSGQTVVAVIDTGVDYRHPDLAANIWTNTAEAGGAPGVDDDGNGYVDDIHGYDFANHDGDPLDDHGHGTHVAGTIGAVGNNQVGITGINWQVKIMALKILDAQGSGSTSDAILALNYAVANGATISNNSYGGDPFSQAFFNAIRDARDAGHIFVTAAGNGNFIGLGINNDRTPFYPSSYNLANIVAVAATDHTDNIAIFSNYGATSVDLGAPGVDILSTLPNNQYGYSTGTSMASPHVAGAVALVRDLHPGWTYTQVINQVLGSVDVVPALQGKTVTGGRLNLARAVQTVPIDLSWPAGSLSGPLTGDSQTPFTLNRTYTISGGAAPASFSIAYYASGDTVLGNSDDILLGSETISSAADRAQGSHSGTSPGLLLPSGGTFYLFARLDANNDLFETNEGNNTAQAAQPVVVTGPVILDNGGAGYSETGSGWVSWAAGYNSSLRFHAAGTGSNTASWQVSGLPTGYYLVQATWNGETNHPSNAPYSIYDGTTLLQTVLVDQRPAPSGTVVGGVAFQSLATVQITTGAVRILLSDNANGYVVADAVRLVPIAAPQLDLNWSGGGIDGPFLADTQSPFTITRTYSISGEPAPAGFSIAYYASGDAVLGNSDDILLGSETISSADDRAVGSHSGISPGLLLPTAGTYYLFARLDGQGALLETDETNNVAQEPQQLVVTVPVIVDNGGPGYSETGSGWTNWAAGYNGSLRFHAPGTGANTAGWQASGLPDGFYLVQATWNAEINHPSNAPYSIYDGNTFLKTVLVDQRPAPSGTVVGGVAFQALASVRVSSGTVRVVLSDNANGYVVADAVRVVQIPPPVVDLNWSGGGISGPAAVNAQTSFTINRTYSITGAAPGTFSISYHASGDTVLGNSDDILLGSETISTTADRTVGSHSGTSPSLLLSNGGTYYLFARLDSADTVLENNEGNNAAQAPQPVVVTGPVILDNGTPAYTETGSGWVSWSEGYNGNLRYHAAGTGANTANWQMSGLPPGYYTIQATWNAASNHPSNAPYSIYDGDTLLLTVLVDQRPAPSGTVVGGVAFQNLATVQITTGTVRILLSDNANGYVVADAVRLVPIPAPQVDLSWSAGGINGPTAVNAQALFTINRTYSISSADAPSSFTISYYASEDPVLGNADDILLGAEIISTAADRAIGSHSGTSPSLLLASGGTYYLFARLDNADTVLETSEVNNVAQAGQPVVVTGPVILDNGAPGYVETGSGWLSWAAGYNGNLRYHAPGTGTNTANWQVSGLPPGYYTIQATWNAASNHPSNAPYSIYDGDTLLLTVLVDQRPAPSGTVVGGVAFQNLATVQITTGTVRILLSDNANGYVVADAVRLVPTTAPAGTLSSLSSSGPTLSATSAGTRQQSQQRVERRPAPGESALADVSPFDRVPGIRPLPRETVESDRGLPGRHDSALGWQAESEARPESWETPRRLPRAAEEVLDRVFADLEWAWGA